MSYCQKCGAKVNEEMSFCPKCGAALKVAQPSTEAKPVSPRPRGEKAEKHEKQEKGEKHEKRETGVTGPLIGGLVLIVLGLISLLQIWGFFEAKAVGALFLIAIGVIIIIVAIYATSLARRRHPET